MWVIGAAIALTSLVISLSLRKKELTVIFLGSDSLVELGGGIQGDVDMTYRGEHIRSLSKVSLILRNAGAQPIKEEDVKEPVLITFAGDVEVLSSRVERTSPAFPIEVDPCSGTSVKNCLVCRFRLLNPGDEAQIAVYVQGSNISPPTAFARIVDVKEVSVRDESRRVGSPIYMIWGQYGTVLLRSVLLYNYLLVGLAALVALAGLWSFVRFRRWRRVHEARWNEFFAEFSKVQGDEERQKVSAKFPGVQPKPEAPYSTWTGLLIWNFVFSVVIVLSWLNIALLKQIPR